MLGPLQGLKNRLAEFAREIVTDPNVAPMHGWRHRFKTVGMEAASRRASSTPSKGMPRGRQRTTTER